MTFMMENYILTRPNLQTLINNILRVASYWLCMHTVMLIDIAGSSVLANRVLPPSLVSNQSIC